MEKIVVDKIEYEVHVRGVYSYLSILKVDDLISNSFVIPASVSVSHKTYLVHLIAPNAFLGNKYLVSVIIPKTITSIGDSAFSDCTKLANIVIPESVTEIGRNIFSNCSNLSSVTLPSKINMIPDGTFSGCASLFFLNVSFLEFMIKNLQEGVNYSVKNLKAITSIGSEAFKNCKMIRELSIGKGVTFIGNSAFSGCSNLLSLKIPSSVTSIGESAFMNCKRLSSINIPYNVISIGISVFKGCDSLSNLKVAKKNPAYMSDNGILFSKDRTMLLFYPSTKTVTEYDIPYGVTTIGDCAFYGCCSLKSITIPSSVTSIGACAFWNCERISSISIPLKVVLINKLTFWNCANLTTINILGKDIEIEYNAFKNCNKLTSKQTLLDRYEKKEVVNPDDSLSINDNILKGTKEEHNTNTITDEYFEYHQTSDGISSVSLFRRKTALCGDVEIPSKISSEGNAYFVTSICEYAFQNCKDITSVIIPACITTIGNSAFIGCSGLEDLYSRNRIPPVIEGEWLITDEVTFCALHVPEGSKTEYKKDPFWSQFLYIIEDEFEDEQEKESKDQSFMIESNIEIEEDFKNNYHISNVDDEDLEITTKDLAMTLSEEINLDVDANEETMNIDSLEEVNLEQTFDSNEKHIEKKERRRFLLVNGIKYIKTKNIKLLSIAKQDEESLSGSVEISQGVLYKGEFYPVNSICNSAFKKCSKITSITLSPRITFIGKSAFSGCTALTKFCIKSNQDFSVKDDVLFTKNKTTLVSYPCAKPDKTYVIPFTVNSIAEEAFAECENIWKIFIPAKVTSIERLAFRDCSYLSEIHIGTSKPPIIKDAFENVDKDKCILFVPTDCISEYKAADGWNEFKIISSEYIKRKKDKLLVIAGYSVPMLK